MTSDSGESQRHSFDPADLERRAVRGVGVLFGKTIGLQLATVAATIALARLLAPHDYGAFALALVFQQMTRAALEEGITAALIRRDKPPSAAEQQALTAFTLTVGTVVAVGACVLAFVLLPLAGLNEELVRVTAIGSISLALASLRLIPSLLLIRRFAYGRLAVIEVSETLSFYAFALPAAAIGLGAYSLAGALPIAAAMGALVANVVQKWTRGLRWNFSLVRPLLGFGAWASATLPLQLAREVTFVSLLVAMAGQPMAGFYGLSQRLLAIPLAIYVAVSRAAFPAFSRTEAEAERRQRSTQAIRVAALAATLPLALAAGAARPAVSVLFGQTWLPAADIVVAAALGILLTASVGAVVASLALAEGDTRTPFIASVAHFAVTVGLGLLLVPPLGALGAGIAAGAGNAVFSLWLLVRARSVALATRGPLARIVAVAVVAATAGLTATTGGSFRDLFTALAAVAMAWTVATLLLARDEARLLVALGRRHLRP